MGSSAARHGLGLHSVGSEVLRRAARLGCAGLAGLVLMSSQAAEASPRCQAPAALVRFDAPLPKFAAALAKGEPVRIIALGSSSTQGIGASSPKACYPVKL